MQREKRIRLRGMGKVRVGGYTLVEVLVAVMVVSAIAGSSILGLTQLNNNAVTARLQTCASTIAQSKLDRFLSTTPFRPDLGKVAPELVVGTIEEGSVTVPTVPIYRDPDDPATRVNGWAVTRITDASSGVGEDKVWAARCEVTVAYQYRGKPYWVRLSTIRSSD
jgi:prepilin-type N-terminal cleavage/methylation domain-containing protein